MRRSRLTPEILPREGTADAVARGAAVLPAAAPPSRGGNAGAGRGVGVIAHGPRAARAGTPTPQTGQNRWGKPAPYTRTIRAPTAEAVRHLRSFVPSRLRGSIASPV